MIPIETQIFRLIFPPSGSIPLEKLEAVPHIRQHINSIIDLASTEHGISPPDESAALTTRVIELRDTPGPDGKVRTWRTIAEICGTTLDAVRHRYVKGKATIRNSRIVEDAALSGYDITDKLAEFIEGPTAEVDRLGGSHTEPHNHTRAFNERVVIGHVEPLLIDMVVSRHPKTETEPLQEAEPVTQDGTDEGPQEAEATEDRLKPVSISRKELDLLMWDLHKAGKTLDEISDILYSEGLYYSPKSVRVRLLSQGATL